jgi:hypothetical protein
MKCIHKEILEMVITKIEKFTYLDREAFTLQGHNADFPYEDEIDMEVRVTGYPEYSMGVSVYDDGEILVYDLISGDYRNIHITYPLRMETPGYMRIIESAVDKYLVTQFNLRNRSKKGDRT